MRNKKTIAKTKRNNQTRNKLTKRGVIKSTKKVRKDANDVSKLIQKTSNQNDPQSEESDQGEDMLSMVETDDLEFIKNAVANRSYSILNKVRLQPRAKINKRKLEEDDNLEQDYENDESKDFATQFKTLLPIKTKTGIVQRSIEKIDDEENIVKEESAQTEQHNEDEENDYVFQDNDLDITKPITTAQLLATREEALKLKKLHIGTLSSGLLETPEAKITNFRTLLQILDDTSIEVFSSVRKLAVISLLEVFKDLLPSYQIQIKEKTAVKFKKDTLKLYKYEESLVLYYRKFLQKLEKFAAPLFKKRGDTRIRTEDDIKLGELAIHVMCELLETHPYFNYATNIAQVLVPFLNNRNKNVREMVSKACQSVFKEDKKQEITLKILRILNQYLKNHAHNVNVEMLQILLYLKIKDVNLDKDKEDDIKQKKLLAKKQSLLQQSKKEKKRSKRLEYLKKEMLETSAEENIQVKQQNLTDITKIVFGIYFRVLKTSTNTKILGTCLEGLAKYAHCINLEYYVDIVNLLDNLLRSGNLQYREQLHCIQTVFAILSGYGEALTLDPTRFYVSLYRDLLTADAAKGHCNYPVLLDTLVAGLIKRQKKSTVNRTVGFVKRLAMLSLQLLHESALSTLGVIKALMQMCKATDLLLDLDSTTGGGEYRAEILDPEYCNAGAGALYEVALLTKHYHPIINKYARHIASGVPASGEGSLPPQIGKCTPQQLYEDYNTSQMAFNPPVAIPKKIAAKAKPTRIHFIDEDFKRLCYKRLRTHSYGFYINI